MDTTISAYHSADCPEVMRGVACSGGIGGAGALHCTPGPCYTYSAAVYASRFPYVMHTPSECDGDRTHRSLGLETRPPSRAHTLRFFSGWGIIDPGTDGRPLLVWCQRFSGCTPRAVVLAGGFTARALCTWDSFHCPRRCCRRVGRRYPKLVQCLYIRDSSHCPDTGHKKFFSPPLRPI